MELELSMKLEFSKGHLSIEAFPEKKDLPPMTIIVGINGSGKSHLLQAIQNGCVSNDVEPSRGPFGHGVAPNIPLLLNERPSIDFETIYTTPFPDRPPQDLPDANFQDFMRYRTVKLRPFLEELSSLLGDGKLSDLPEDRIWSEEASWLIARLGVEHFRSEIKDIYDRAEKTLQGLPESLERNPVPSQESSDRSVAKDISLRREIPMLKMTARNYKNLLLSRVNAEHFSLDLATIFGKYRDLRLYDRLQQLQDVDDGWKIATDNRPFEEQNGVAPWTQINKVLHEFDLPFEIIAPPLNEFGQVRTKFRKLPGNKNLDFGNLSSGEKVLVQLAISSFQIDANFINLKRPKLLLLDEMDASLHPEWVQRWLRAIEGALVDKLGTHCILTTHSPTTVALAPEDALYEMKDGRSGLTKISKQQALNNLTYGVPTLSIDFSGRRQVFTENDTDAEIYEDVYALIKSRIECSRELNFIGTGIKIERVGDFGAGSTIVRKIVAAMVQGKSRSTYGIVDWDCVPENRSEGRIKVLAEGRRHSIENVILDPLLVCLLLMVEKKAPPEVQDIAGFVAAVQLPPEELQCLVDAVQNAVVEVKTGEKVQVFYLGGASVEVFKEYLEMNGHALQAALAEQFPCLKEWTSEKAREPLKKRIVKYVLSEHVIFCPIELKELFEGIANCELD
jgi:predicted ATPase